MAAAPNKAAREKCYTFRDAHFKCLDENDNDLYKCSETFAKMEETCPRVWIKHFEQTREREMFERIVQKRRTSSNS